MLISNYERIYYTTVNRIANIIVSKLISLHDHRVPRLMTFCKMMTCLVLYRVAFQRSALYTLVLIKDRKLLILI